MVAQERHDHFWIPDLPCLGLAPLLVCLGVTFRLLLLRWLRDLGFRCLRERVVVIDRRVGMRRWGLERCFSLIWVL